MFSDGPRSSHSGAPSLYRAIGRNFANFSDQLRGKDKMLSVGEGRRPGCPLDAPQWVPSAKTYKSYSCRTVMFSCKAPMPPGTHKKVELRKKWPFNMVGYWFLKRVCTIKIYICERTTNYDVIKSMYSQVCITTMVNGKRGYLIPQPHLIT